MFCDQEVAPTIVGIPSDNSSSTTSACNAPASVTPTTISTKKEREVSSKPNFERDLKKDDGDESEVEKDQANPIFHLESSNKFYELLGVSPYYELMVPLTVVFVSIVFLCSCYGITNLGPTTFLKYFLIGYFNWLFCEYSEHRWNHEMPEYDLDDHYYHHLYPYDHNEVIMEFQVSIPAYLLSFVWFLCVTGDMEISACCSAGFVTGYLAYEWVHFLAHLPNQMLSEWQIKLSYRHRRHHMSHPRKDYNTYFPVFDFIFGTMGDPNWKCTKADRREIEYRPRGLASKEFHIVKDKLNKQKKKTIE